MGFTIRPAQQQDAAAICRLSKESLGYEECTEELCAQGLEAVLDSPENQVWVAETDGGVVGYIHSAHYQCVFFPPLKNIMALSVDNSCRRAGVGKALLEVAEGQARQDGCAGVRLVSGANRHGAHRFYEAQGYTNRKSHLNFVKYFEG